MYNLVNGSKIFYPMLVVALFVVYIVVFYRLFHLLQKKKTREKSLV